MVQGTKGPGSFIPGNGPGNEWSYRPFVPENESSTMGTNSLGNEQS